MIAFITIEGYYGYTVARMQDAVKGLSWNHTNFIRWSITKENIELLNIDFLLRQEVTVIHGNDIGEEVLLFLYFVNYGFCFILGFFCVDYQLKEGFQGSEHFQQIRPELNEVFLVRDDFITLSFNLNFWIVAGSFFNTTENIDEYTFKFKYDSLLFLIKGILEYEFLYLFNILFREFLYEIFKLFGSLHLLCVVINEK